jgi:hypothetical protein
MVSYWTGTQQKTVSSPLTIHPSWCTGGCCWFTVAACLGSQPATHCQAYQVCIHAGFVSRTLLLMPRNGLLIVESVRCTLSPGRFHHSTTHSTTHSILGMLSE